MDVEFDYSKMIHLDAESLAEQGILDAYQNLLPTLRMYVKTVDDITEIMDPDAPRYAVRHRDVEYVIHGPEIEDEGGRSWGNATYALFSIVNAQLSGMPCRFYAINGGNDLAGMFLTPEQWDAAKRTLEARSDWPYLPTADYPFFGQES
jgi:hypothetical protein